MKFSPVDSLRKLKEYDDSRPGFKGEHWLALGAGAALLMASRRSPSTLKRTMGSALGSALLLRAATGRQGLGKSLTGALRYLPVGKRSWRSV
ncbi:MAG: hypothetical protein JWR60_2365 [Polaromonas sp.]|nr:hypothetical protein [Polaromonas sp.]